MAFNSKIIKKSKKSHGMEEMEPKEAYETSEDLETYSPKSKLGISADSVPMDMKGLKSSSVPPSDIGSIKKISEYNKPGKGENSLKLDALISAAAKKKLPVKASVEKEVEISPMKEEKKPTEFVQHGGSLLQYLKKKK